MCFGTKSISTPKATSQVISSSGPFKVGDEVKIIRKAVKNENGWDNSWVREMDKAVGQIAKITSLHEGEARLSVPSIGDGFYFPLFVLEPVNTLGGFKVGDRVQVTKKRAAEGAGRLTGPATVVGLDDYVQIETDTGFHGGFLPTNLEFLAPAAEVKAAAQDISAAVNSHNKVFATAQAIAIDAAKTYGSVNADKVQDLLIGQGYTSTDLGNAAGALFRGKNWKKVGTIKSTRQGNHAREISNWQYVGV